MSTYPESGFGYVDDRLGQDYGISLAAPWWVIQFVEHSHPRGSNDLRNALSDDDGQ